MAQVAVAIVVSACGARLDTDAVNTAPARAVLDAEFATVGVVTCAALTLEYDGGLAQCASRLATWAAQCGWSVTVASVQSGD